MRPHSIWSEIAPSPRKHGERSRPAQRKRKQYLFLLKKIKIELPSLFEGVLNAKVDKKEIESFCHQLSRDVAGHLYKQRKNLFIMGLEKGREQLNWDVYIPAPITTNIRGIPKFTYNSMAGLSMLRKLESSYIKSLETLSVPSDKNLLLGYILFSASVYGGLLSNRWILAWLRSPYDNLIYEDGMAWVDLYIDVTRKSGSSDEVVKIHRRWFVDPLTLLLLGKFKGHISERSIGRIDPLVYLKKLFRHIELEFAQCPKSLNAFLACAHVRISLYSKPYLADFATESLKSSSLSPEIWCRVRTSRSIAIPKDKSVNISEIHVQKQSALEKKLSHQRMSSKLWSQFYEAIYPKVARDKKNRVTSGESKSRLKDFVATPSSELSPLGWLLGNWAINLLSYKRGIRKGSKIAASSVHTYVTTIGKPLQVHMCAENLLDYSECEFYDLYKDVIDDKKSEKNKQATAIRLSDFHDYLVVHWDVPRVDLSEFHMGHYRSELGVDSNLLCPSMYQSTLDALGGLTLDQPRDNIMAVIITILGFKCGLRRAEAMTILCSDICGDYAPVLFLRHNKYAYKKSDNAIRKVNLKTFLSQKERAFIKSWLNKRNEEDKVLGNDVWVKDNLRRLLFCIPGQPTEPVGSEIFEAIHEAMRQVTLDPNIHYHSLRHSFASWFLYRLESNDLKIWRPGNIRALTHPINSYRRCVLERRYMQIDERINRKALYQLALACGHASPEISLRHYVHILDLLLGINLSKPSSQPELSLDIIKNLVNIKTAMAYRIRKKSLADKWLASSFSKTAMKPLNKEYKDYLIRSTRGVDDSFVEVKRQPISWPGIQSVLEDRLLKRMSLQSLSQKYGEDEQIVEKWLNNARALYKMRTRETRLHPKGKPRHRVDTDRLPFPTRPVTKYDIAIADRILNKYITSEEQQKLVIEKHVQDFVDQFWLSSSDMRFTDEDKALHYLGFLKLIGIKEDEVKLIHYKGKMVVDSEAEKQLAHWGRLLSIPLEQCHMDATTHGQSKNNGTIGLMVNTIVGVQSDGASGLVNKFSSPYGFRYAMYIIYLMHNSLEDVPKTS